MGYDSIDLAENLEKEAYRLSEACEQLEKGTVDRSRVFKILLHGNRAYDHADRRAQELRPDMEAHTHGETFRQPDEPDEIIDGETNYLEPENDSVETPEISTENDVDPYEIVFDIEGFSTSLRTDMENSDDPLDRLAAALDTYREALKRVECTEETGIDFSNESDLDTYTPESVGPFLDDFEPLFT